MGKEVNIARMLPIGANLVCSDNSGAKKLQIIGVLKTQGTRKRRLSAGVGSVVSVRITKGLHSMKKKVRHALIIRQKYAYLRKSGPYMGKVKFTDNAAILLSEKKDVMKSVVKGVIAKEVLAIKRFSDIKGIAR